MQNPDDEVLSRFLDGELDPSWTAESRADLTKSERAGALTAQDDKIRAWFDAHLEMAPDQLARGVRQGFAARRRARRTPHWWALGAAAAAVAVVAMVGASYLIDRRVDAVLDQMRAERASDMAVLTAAMQDVLETRESGIAVSFQNETTGLAVSITPRRTWKSSTGHWCREFSEVIEQTDVRNEAVGTACRATNGRWQRVLTEMPGNKVPLIFDPVGWRHL